MAEILGLHQQCRSQSGISDAVISNVLRGDFTYSPELGTHLHCMSRRLGIQDESGRINRNVLRQRLAVAISDQNTIDNLVNQCAVEQATPEMTAVQASECFFNGLRGSLG